MPEDTAPLQAQVAHQLRIIKQGSANLIGEEDLKKKLERSVLTKTPLKIKFGMDPSAPDLHLGHAVALRKLKQLQDLGHTVIIIVGDFTGKIGDPTGKSKGRNALTDAEVLRNAQTYQEQVFHILDREKTIVRYNGEWLELLQLDQVLKLASTITVARMLERDDFQTRFRNNTPIGLHEFFYPLMQAYDSVEIEADLELGGTDQTFNILMGRSLQKDMGQEPQAALFMPLLEGTDGVEKMSKSLGNYIGIYEDARTIFQKTMQIPDNMIVKYFELATDILPEELDRVKAELENGCNPRDIKLRLAKTVTSLYHTAQEAEDARDFFIQAFSKREIPDQADTLSVPFGQGKFSDYIRPLVAAGYAASGGELRRMVAQGGIRKNGTQLENVDELINSGDVLRIGKRRFVKITYDM
ncbi:MAG: tyrosine--tRNA ligase [Lachnospiraceae bacterium]|nr:tyrosine--tRNA ligase [Lachnospiraceae bacterium]MCM1240009.1 tyrosine--tRNA ligase [Lachnospiraceae bacterium]